MKTLKEVVEALRTIDDGAADYIENNFNEEDFQKGISIRELNNPNPLGPLNFFTWDNYTKFRSFNDWRELNKKLAEMRDHNVKYCQGDKMNTLKDVVAFLRIFDPGAANYIEEQFTGADFRDGAGDHCGITASAPLDFFAWVEHPFRRLDEWQALNKNLKDIKREKTINLDDYTTKDIDFTGCNPVVAEAIKQNKSILCNAMDDHDYLVAKEEYIVNYIKELEYPYVTISEEPYKYVEPKKKSEVQIRVKGPVEVMQWLVENDWKSNELGVFRKKNSSREFDFRAISACGKKEPEWWSFPELLEKVAIND